MDYQKRMQELQAGLAQLQQKQQEWQQQGQQLSAAILRQEGAILMLEEVLQAGTSETEVPALEAT